VSEGDVVTRELLASVALPEREPAHSQVIGTPVAGQQGETVADWCARHGVSIARTNPRDGGWTYYVLADGCLWDAAHRDAALTEGPEGHRGYKCFHNSCSGYRWRDVRERVGDMTARGARAPDVAYQGGGTLLERDERASWPFLARAALHGIAGEIVALIAPHTEADPAALLMLTLAACGCAIGLAPHARVGATRHPARLFVAIVGASAKARKGTAQAEVDRVMAAADEEWARRCRTSGLSSGEGLIWAVHDEVTEHVAIREKGRVTGYEDLVTHPAVDDKRLLVIEAELSSPIRRMAGETNTLSPLLRLAWDTGDLRVMTTGRRQRPVTATGAHLCIVGHITEAELLRVLDATDLANGFANRFLFVCARRSRLLPFGGALADADVLPIARRLGALLNTARTRGRLDMDMEAAARWTEVYAELAEAEPGMLGAIVARGEAHTLRLALLYALLDGDDRIRLPHLEAARAVWRYCHDSARYIFGESLGDPLADTLLSALRDAGPEGLTRTALSAALGRHASAAAIGRALRALEGAGRVRSETRATGGRPAVVYLYVGAKEAKKAKEVPPMGSGDRDISLSSLLSQTGSVNGGAATVPVIDPLPCDGCGDFTCVCGRAS
jgi:hypothetical protein